MSYTQSLAARKRWAKPGAREAQSERVIEAMRLVPAKTEMPKPIRYGKRCGISIYIDQSTYDELAKMTKRRRKSAAELIRTYIEWGLETDGEGK